MTNEEIKQKIRTCHLWKSGNVMTASDAASRVASRTREDYDIVRTAQVLGEMVKNGEAVKLPTGGYMRRADAQKWLRTSWRRRTNESLGLVPTRLGVPV